MIDIGTVPSVPLFDDLFDSMVIAGHEGLAIAKESLHRRESLTIGRDLQGKCIRNRLAGEPHEVVSSVVVPVETYQRIHSLLDGPFKRNGVIAADMLDGVSYFVKWVTVEKAIRLVISNPDELTDEVRSFVARLETILCDLD